ncbi:MAG: hypothetical protein WD708_08860 [Kiritimatiellia bacterium]
MYEWRKLTDTQRFDVLNQRIEDERLWHTPTHFIPDRWIHITAACFEHRHLIGHSFERIHSFSRDLQRVIHPPLAKMRAWCVLPNHYHALAEVYLSRNLRRELGKLHGRSSHIWNVEEGCRGRQCFHGCLMKEIKSEAHWWSTVNYIHHNPVKHGHADTWMEWPFSSARLFLETTPRETAKKIWSEYPITGMGKNWDE